MASVSYMVAEGCGQFCWITREIWRYAQTNEEIMRTEDLERSIVRH